MNLYEQIQDSKEKMIFGDLSDGNALAATIQCYKVSWENKNFREYLPIIIELRDRYERNQLFEEITGQLGESIPSDVNSDGYIKKLLRKGRFVIFLRGRLSLPQERRQFEKDLKSLEDLSDANKLVVDTRLYRKTRPPPLKSLKENSGVPFMVEALPDDFVERPKEFEQLISCMLDETQEKQAATTVALRGAGGYGKTTLAKAVCHDERIRRTFEDGVLWVTLGENPGDLTKRIEDLIYILSAERPGFSSIEAAVVRWIEVVADRCLLIVIDDVWNTAHLKPFMQGGPQCTRLITTRSNLVLSQYGVQVVMVDAMRQNEAIALLGFGLPSSEERALCNLAARLGEWPLLLKLVNGVLRSRVNSSGQKLSVALTYVSKALDRYGLTAFDARSAIERNQAVGKTMRVSLELLSEDERNRYGKLAIFPEDIDIPLTGLMKKWITLP
jgi:hypothetical protein